MSEQQPLTLSQLRERVDELTGSVTLLGERKEVTSRSVAELEQTKNFLDKEIRSAESDDGFAEAAGKSASGFMEFLGTIAPVVPFLVAIVSVVSCLIDCGEEVSFGATAVASVVRSDGLANSPPVGAGCVLNIQLESANRCRFILTCGEFGRSDVTHCWEGSYVTEDSEGDETTHYYLLAGNAEKVELDEPLSFDELDRLLVYPSERENAVVVVHSLEGSTSL